MNGSTVQLGVHVYPPSSVGVQLGAELGQLTSQEPQLLGLSMGSRQPSPPPLAVPPEPPRPPGPPAPTLIPPLPSSGPAPPMPPLPPGRSSTVMSPSGPPQSPSTQARFRPQATSHPPQLASSSNTEMH